MDYQTIKSLVFTFSPFLISYGLSYYRNFRTQVRSSRQTRRALPAHVRPALGLLLAAAVLVFTFGLPWFAPENIIKATSSRLQTPPDVLYRRLASIRPDGKLTPFDEMLRSHTNTTSTKLLYVKYGPDTMANCPFCFSDDPKTYFIYALPSMLLPHLANLAVLGLSTSAALTRAEGSRWRLQAVLAGCVLAIVDVSVVSAHDPTRNALALRAENLTHFFWIMRAFRYWGIGLIDSVFAVLLWATSTNRILVAPLTAAAKVQHIALQMEVLRGKANAANIIREATVHDSELQQKQMEFWGQNAAAMHEIMEDEEVRRTATAAMNGGSLDLRRMTQEAGQYAEKVLGSIYEAPTQAR